MEASAAPWGKRSHDADALVWALQSALLPAAVRSAILLAHTEPQPLPAPLPAPDIVEIPNVLSSQALHTAMNMLRPGNVGLSSLMSTLEAGDFAPYQGHEGTLLPLMALVVHLRAQGDPDMEERVARILLRLERHGLAYSPTTSTGTAPPLNRVLHALRTHTLRLCEDSSAARAVNQRLEIYEVHAIANAVAAEAALNATNASGTVGRTQTSALRVQAVTKHMHRAKHHLATHGVHSLPLALQVRAAAALASASAAPPSECVPFLVQLWHASSTNPVTLRPSVALLLATVLRSVAHHQHVSPALVSAILDAPVTPTPSPLQAHDTSQLLVACAAHGISPVTKQQRTREWLQSALTSGSGSGGAPSGAHMTAAVFVLSDEPQPAHAASLALALVRAHAHCRGAHLLPLFRLFRAAALERAADVAWYHAIATALLSDSHTHSTTATPTALTPTIYTAPALLPLPSPSPPLHTLVALAALVHATPTTAPVPPSVLSMLTDTLQAPTPPALISERLNQQEVDIEVERDAVRVLALLEAGVWLPLVPITTIGALMNRALTLLHTLALPLYLFAAPATSATISASTSSTSTSTTANFSLAPLERHAHAPVVLLAAPLTRAIAQHMPRLTASLRAPLITRLRTRAETLNASVAPHLMLLLSPRAPGRRAVVRLLQAEHLAAVLLSAALLISPLSPSTPPTSPPPGVLVLTEPLSADEAADMLDALAALDFFRAALPAFAALLMQLAHTLAKAKALDALVVRHTSTLLAAPAKDLLPASRASFYLLFARVAAPLLSPAPVLHSIAPAIAEALRRPEAIGRTAHTTCAALLAHFGSLLTPLAPYLIHTSLSGFPTSVPLHSFAELLRAVVRYVPDDAAVLLACHNVPPRVSHLFGDSERNPASADMLAINFFRLLLLCRLSLLPHIESLVLAIIRATPPSDKPILIRAIQQFASTSLDYQRKNRLIQFYHLYVLPLAMPDKAA